MRRVKRRIAGMLRKRNKELKLHRVKDPRKARGKRWKLSTLLTAVLAAMMDGAKGLTEVEELTVTLSPELRRLLGIHRRVPDTTLRTVLCGVDPTELRAALVRAMRAAHRRKALEPDVLPFGVVSLDGKATALTSVDDYYAQRQTKNVEPGRVVGVVRTISAVLTSSRARPFLDVAPVPAATNEMGVFERAFRELVGAYDGLKLFRLVTYDAGACSEKNAKLVCDLGFDYLFAVKDTQATLLSEAKLCLEGRDPIDSDATTEDHVRGQTVTRRLYHCPVEGGFGNWEHLRTFVRVQSETHDSSGKLVSREDRYFLSSLSLDKLRPEHWLRVVRGHWGVEIAHEILDVSFEEDDRRWIESDPQGNVVAVILRRIAYTLLSLYRSITLRGDDNRVMPWKRLLGRVHATLLTDAPLGLSPPAPVSLSCDA